MIDPFAFRKSLREAWVIAKVIRMRLRFSWLLNRNALLEIDGCVFHYHWQVVMAVLANSGCSGERPSGCPDKDAPLVNGRAFRRARPEPIHRR